jgi:hypothetical protein
MVYSLWSIALYALWGVAAKGREKRLTIDYRLLTYFFSLPMPERRKKSRIFAATMSPFRPRRAAERNEQQYETWAT